ncbi:MAG: hypothetical protein WC878_05765 [Candidatus Paceibacterota bacterium]
MAIIFCALFFGAGKTHSQEFVSANYTVLDPVMNAGGYGTSTNFGLLGVMSQISNGEGTSATFGNNAGFLYFPTVASPVVYSSAGDAQVILSWAPCVGSLGWTVSGYSVAQSTISGGPYTYTSLGNVTSATRTGLSNGTPYYFVIVVKDSFGNAIASSTQVSATPASSGGGGGGGSPPPTETKVEFAGRAYPMSTVSILKDGAVAVFVVAGPDGNFFTSLSGLSAGNYTFSSYAEDKNGILSGTLTFPVSVTAGATTRINGIFLPPTIAVDKSIVKKGDTIAISGQTMPNASVTVNIDSGANIFMNGPSDGEGAYLFNFDSSVLEYGDYTTVSKAVFAGETSPFSKTVTFKVGTTTVEEEPEDCPTKGDLNDDCRVDLVDFSIATYWFKKPLSGAFELLEEERLNASGKIDLIDFSIMAYYWTG